MELVAFGVPSGYSSMKCSATPNRFLENFYCKDSGKKMRISKLPSGEVFYTYLVYPKKNEKFLDVNGRDGAFFGVSLIFKNQYCKDVQKIYNMFEDFYNNSIKNNIVKENENGIKRFLVSSLSSQNVEDFIVNSFTKNSMIRYNFRDDIADFKFSQRDNRCFKVNVMDANSLIDAQMKSPYDIEISRDIPQMQNIKNLGKQRC